jgi:membrane protein implicated in regulation of membrane protease activity
VIDPDATITFWHWLVLAVLLAVVEVLAPGTFFLWLGISAAVVGIVAWLAPGLAWEWQALLFAVLAVASVLLVRRYLKSRPIETDQPLLNRRGHQYVGRTFTLEEPVVNGQGKIRVDDSTWKVEGEDCPTGAKVRVSGVDGVVLQIEILERPAG